MKTISTIGLYINGLRDPGYVKAAEIAAFLKGWGRGVYVCGGGGYPELGLEKTAVGNVDCLVVLGGDGTLLKAANTAAFTGTPLLGVNMGRLGYLTDAGAADAIPALERLLTGEFSVERRIMLEASVDGKDCRLALNDAMAGREGSPKLLSFKVDINGENMDTYQADGVLVATPTGSTAYNLSAGGPIIKPDADILTITPICPHSLHVRSAVISAQDTVSVTVLSEAKAALFMDGEQTTALAAGDTVTIRRSDYVTNVIKTTKQGFYDILRKKMR